MSKDELKESGYYITEIHPALSMWILLKEVIQDKLFSESWKYKGDTKSDTLQRREVLIKNLLVLDIVKKALKEDIKIESDDELDAFLCWLVAYYLVEGDSCVTIYGDRLNGSFLLPYDELIYQKLNDYLDK